MLSNLRTILSIGFGLVVWGGTIEIARAQFGGLQIQIGGSPYGGGTGMYVGGVAVPFGVGPLMPPSPMAYMGLPYRSGYRGYYAVPPALGVYASPFSYPSPMYSNYQYSSQTSLDPLQLQQFALQRQQLELQPGQSGLSAQQLYPYDVQSRYSVQSPKGSSSNDLQPGMVLPDGSTVVSVGPLSPASSTRQPPSSQQSSAQQSTVAPPNVLPSGSPEAKKAAF